MSELYLFQDGTEYHAFTPTVFNKTFNSRVYVATAISRSKLTLTDNVEKSSLDFVFPKNNTFAINMLLNLPETPVKITVYRDGLTYWLGQVIDVKANNPSIIIVGDSEQFTLARKGLTARMSPECRHTLYTPNCGVIKELWKTDFTGVTPTGVNVTVTGLASPNGTYDNGEAIFQGQSRRIIKQIGSTITLSNGFNLNSSVTGTISLYPGCHLTEANCLAFNNLDNYGGWSRMAHINPFSSTGLI